jgi:hypothetical protein
LFCFLFVPTNSGTNDLVRDKNVDRELLLVVRPYFLDDRVSWRSKTSCTMIGNSLSMMKRLDASKP